MGVEIKKSSIRLPDVEGKFNELNYLESEVDGKKYYHPLDFAAQGEIVQLPVYRSVIRALHLDPISFGLVLDKPSAQGYPTE